MFLVGPRFILSKLVRFAIFFTHITMVFTMYRIYNRQRKQEKTERVLPLSHKHFIPPLYTYVYRKDQVSPVPGLFVFYSRPPRFALYCLLPQAGPSLIVQKKQMSASQPLVFPFTHYIISYMALIFPPFYLENCVSFFFFSPFSPLICYAILDLVQKDSKKHIIF